MKTFSTRLAALETSLPVVSSEEVEGAILRESARSEAHMWEFMAWGRSYLENGRMVWRALPVPSRDRDEVVTIVRLLSDDTMARAARDAELIRLHYGHATDQAMGADDAAQRDLYRRQRTAFGDELYRSGQLPGGRYAGGKERAEDDEFSIPYVERKAWPRDPKKARAVAAKVTAEVEATFGVLLRDALASPSPEPAAKGSRK